MRVGVVPVADWTTNQCQKDAWQSPGAPHKAYCSKIRKLRGQFGEDGWALLWTADMTYARFQELCRAKSVDQELVHEISDGLARVMVYKALRWFDS
jgi:hypothetical protein